MREITTHKGDPHSNAIKIRAYDDDEPGYIVDIYGMAIHLPFFNHPHSSRVGAVTEKALLAIVADRLQCRYDSGSSEGLAKAIDSVTMALAELKSLAKKGAAT